jgi:signal transduction histidine kinase
MGGPDDLSERMRIARELHDIVAHDVSVMLVLAQAARATLDVDPARARAALVAVEATGREASDELRRMLHVLRPDASEAAVEPLPSLARVNALLASRDDVELRTEGDAGRLPGGVDVAAYRIVEGALARARDARVTMRWAPNHLALEIEATGELPALAGLRERAAMCGGQLTTQVRATGYVIRARLPREPAVSPPAPATA